MRLRIVGWVMLLLLLALAGRAQANQTSEEQVLSFSEVSHGDYRIAYATIDAPVGAEVGLRGADLQLAIACQDALGELTLSAMSLWEDLPAAWEDLLESDESVIGLFFPAEEDDVFHAEISSLLMDWSGEQSVLLALVFDCSEVNCDCSPIIATGALSLALGMVSEP